MAGSHVRDVDLRSRGVYLKRRGVHPTKSGVYLTSMGISPHSTGYDCTSRFSLDGQMQRKGEESFTSVSALPKVSLVSSEH